MNKRKIGICICDKVYEERFVMCLMNHYKDQYEIHVISSLLEIGELQEKKFHAVITGDEEMENTISLAKKGQDVLILKEREIFEEENQEHLVYTEKYQEVYKIIEALKGLIEDGSKEVGPLKKKYRLVGISSFGSEGLQLPFAAMSASIYGENASVLLVDLQPYSAIEDANGEDLLSMEDLLSVATTGIFTKSRVLGAIGHEQKWDYVRPVQNSECLVEANEDIYLKMIDMLATEQGYDVVILNFGTVFTGMFDLMDRCHDFYLVEEKAKFFSWREQVFFREMKQRGKERFLEKVTRMELIQPQGRGLDWRAITQQWLWGAVGNQLRECVWAGCCNG